MFTRTHTARSLTRERCVDAPADRLATAAEAALAPGALAARTEALDRQRSERWAVAVLGSFGGGVGFVAAETARLEFVNLRTMRAHRFVVSGLGISTPSIGGRRAPVSASTAPAQRAVSYAEFETRRPMNALDFDRKRVRFTSGNVGVAAVNYMMIFEGIPLFSRQIAYVRMTGWDLNIPGASAIVGRLQFLLEEDRPSGLVRAQPSIERPPRERVPPGVSIRTATHERPRIEIPNEVLFAFDSAELTEAAEPQLEYLARLLARRRRYLVDVEGHTDSLGEPAYNRALSERRAAAVRRWFVTAGVEGAEDFRIHGLGASDPVAPNTRPDGSDDPEGRARNRRVTLRAAWNL